VRITDVADACGVSEKTVYNYFPTKESLILDRWQSTPAALLGGLADPSVLPMDAALGVLESELKSWTAWFARRSNAIEASARVRRFVDLVQATPSLRAYERDVTDELVVGAARVLAGRIGADPDDPEPQIAAGAILDLWRVQGRSLRRHLDGTFSAAQIHKLVSRDVQRAARLLTAGMATFDTLKRRGPRRRSAAAAPKGH
jgi:AcrR family transcriptional regulator